MKLLITIILLSILTFIFALKTGIVHNAFTNDVHNLIVSNTKGLFGK